MPIQNKTKPRRVLKRKPSQIDSTVYDRPQNQLDIEELLAFKEPECVPEKLPLLSPAFKKKYDREMADVAYELTLFGVSGEVICKVLGIDIMTFHTWRKVYPEFNEAIKKALTKASAKVVSGPLMDLIYGGVYEEEVVVFDKEAKQFFKTTQKKYRPPNFQAIAFFLKNKHPNLWNREKAASNNLPTNTQVITADPKDATKDKVYTINLREFDTAELLEGLADLEDSSFDLEIGGDSAEAKEKKE